MARSLPSAAGASASRGRAHLCHQH
eukprot:SAG31_NODE_12201_length_959_cov_1.166279_2_plen_24_part_01